MSFKRKKDYCCLARLNRGAFRFGEEDVMIEIVPANSENYLLDWKFYLTEEDQPECGCIQDQIIAQTWGWA